MFDKIGKLSSKYRYPIIIAWIALLVVISVFAPNLSDVAISEQSGYLPEDELSVIAANVAIEYFPDKASPTQAVLVFESENGSLHDEDAQAHLAYLTHWLENDLSPDLIGQVLSPTEPSLADQLISDDGRSGMIFVSLRGDAQDPAVVEVLEAMQARLADTPAGMTGYVTGDAAITNDYQTSAMESADRTTLFTLILVITVLLIIYRSPVAPIVPLATIGVAYGVSRGLVAWLTNFGFTVTSMTDVFLVVLLFGAGTDYCLFLVSRFREFMADDLPGPNAARHTVARVGETITSSAGTVIVGMVAMSFAEMKLFASSGPSLALGIFVALLAGLTLTPAMLAVLGRWAFWPGRPRHSKAGGFWSKQAHWVTTKPWLPLALAVVALLPLAVFGQGQRRTFDLLADLPNDVPSKAGFLLLSEHFGAGEMQPLDVIVTDIPDARSPEGMAGIDALTRDLLTMEGVADVRSLTLPAGQQNAELSDALRADAQLTLMADAIDDLREQADDPSALADMDLDEALAGFDTLRTYLDELATAFPDLADNVDYQAVQEALEGLEEAIEDGRQRLLVSNQLAEAAAGISGGLEQQGLSGAAAMETLVGATAQFSTLRAYLAGLAEAHPALANLDGYDDALAALDDLEATMDEISAALLVSTQLDLLAEGIAGMAVTLEDPAALGEMSDSPDQIASLDTLDAYLEELVKVYPSLAEQSAYQSATEHLAAVAADVEEMMQGLLVHNQLALVAQQMEAMAQALEENPMALMPQPGEPSAVEQMGGLVAYLEELGAAYPSLAATGDYQTAMTVMAGMGAAFETIDISQVAELIVQAKESLTTLSAAFAGLSTTAAETLPEATFMPEGMAAFAPDLSPIVDEVTAASQDFAALAETVRQETPDATFVPKTALPTAEAIPDPLATLEASLDDLATALNRLAAASAADLPEATYIPSEELVAGEAAADDMADAILADVDALQSSLYALADELATRDDAFFIPTALAEGEEQEGITRLLDTYTSLDGDATRLQVVLADEPFSPAALDTVARLRDEVRHASQGHVSGTSAVLLDLRDVMARDLVRVMVLTMAGITVVLVLLLRSLVAPIYMMATILLSYGATMGITRLVFDSILGKGLSWWVPFFIFVLLVALGMDYNIFLMGRVKEETAQHGTREGIERAVEHTGGIITAAGIIMAGTFAAMMSSSLLGLVQLAFAVTIGVLLDTFVIRTTLMPAIATLLGKWNWWPGKEPGK